MITGSRASIEYRKTLERAQPPTTRAVRGVRAHGHTEAIASGSTNIPRPTISEMAASGRNVARKEVCESTGLDADRCQRLSRVTAEASAEHRPPFGLGESTPRLQVPTKPPDTHF